jgi:hypothetical protein
MWSVPGCKKDRVPEQTAGFCQTNRQNVLYDSKRRDIIKQVILIPSCCAVASYLNLAQASFSSRSEVTPGLRESLPEAKALYGVKAMPSS